jgi:membrane protease YdiL (CAAX protease family)
MLLRALRPAPAIGTSALLFAFVQFWDLPSGVTIADPGCATAGFELLGRFWGRFGDPLALTSEFGTLLAEGLVLGYARWRTASLWLPAGLHAGWVLVCRVFRSLTVPLAPAVMPAGCLVGHDLREGLVPMLAVLAAGLLVHALTVDDARQLHPAE